MKSNELVILTGAGFSKDFGGFLAEEMWSKIFNHPLTFDFPRIKKCLKDDVKHDYEDAYSKIMKDDFYSEERETIIKILEDVYTQLDHNIIEKFIDVKNTALLDAVTLSAPKKDTEKIFFFTLNQDLLIERYVGNVCPGVHSFRPINMTRLQEKDFVNLIVEDKGSLVEKDIENSADTIYIKLHGSFGWRSSDGTNAIVVGHNKDEDTEREPLLKVYKNLFKDVLVNEGSGKKILIIGYSFGDEHINKVLNESAEKNNSEIFIIDTLSPKEFERQKLKYPPDSSGAMVVKNRRDMEYIWKRLSGYFPYSMAEINNGKQLISEIKRCIWREIKK